VAPGGAPDPFIIREPDKPGARSEGETSEARTRESAGAGMTCYVHKSGTPDLRRLFEN